MTLLKELNKELTFDPKNETSDQCTSGNFIKLNLSDSDEEAENIHKIKNDFKRTFSFNNSEYKINNQNNDLNSVIHEEKDEHNDSRNIISVHEWNDTPMNRFQILANSKSSPSLVSCRDGEFFNNLMKSDEKRNQQIEEEENVFKRRIFKQNDKSSDSYKYENYPHNQHSDLEELELQKIIAQSPDDKMRRKRRQRAHEIANNPLMLRSDVKSIEQDSSPEFSNKGGCIKMNLWIQRSEESKCDPDQSYHKPEFKYDLSPCENIYKIDEKERNKNIET